MSTEKKRIKLLKTQDDFIFSEENFTGFGGGWGCGKTLAGIVKTMRHCEQPKARFLVGRLRYTDLRDSTLAQFLELFPDITFLKSEYKMILPNHSEILFRHLDDLHSLTNLNLSGFWIEQAEEVDEDVWNFLVGRLRKSDVKRREAFITFNMDGHNWIWRKKERNEIRIFVATTYENAENLPKDYIESLEKLPEPVKKRYIWGSWDEFAGQVWPMWNEQVHVIEPFHVPDEWYQFLAIDHGFTNPTAIGKFAVDNDENVFLVDEHYEAGRLISYHAERALEMMAGKDMPVFIDPSTRAHSGISGTSILDEYAECGINAIPAPSDVMAGVNKVGEYLRIDPERIHPITRKKGSPRFFIFSTCEHAIAEIPEYRWKTMKSNFQKDEVLKKNDHMCDVIRYAIMSLEYCPSFTDKEDEEIDLYADYKRVAGRTGYVPFSLARV